MDYNKIYYTIPKFGKKKYATIEDAQKVCDRIYNNGSNNFVIVKCVESEISYIPEKSKSHSTESLHSLVELLRDSICNSIRPITRMLRNHIYINCDTDFVEYLYRKGLIPNKPIIGTNLQDCDYPVYQKTFIKYINDLFDAYPTEKITVRMLKTDYRPCNGIEISFPTSEDYVPCDVHVPCVALFHYDQNQTRSLFPSNFTITLRGDNKEKSIVISGNPGICGHHVNFRRYEKVDLENPKTQKYIQSVLKILKK